MQDLEYKRTTIYIPPVVIEHVKKQLTLTGSTISSFVLKACVNQLETCGDFEVRQILAERGIEL